MKLKKEEKASYSTINTRLSAICLFFTMNDIIINRKKIGKYLGEHVKTVRDRAYTRNEIQQIVDACDLKYKVFVLLMVSTGCRLGAIPPLKLRNIVYIEQHKLYKVTFYEDTTKYEYYSFTTPECAKYIDEYLEYRKRCGERLNQNSPLIRDDFILDDHLHIEHPKHLKIPTFKFYLRNVLISTGIRQVTPNRETHEYKRNRTSIAQNHGFRKFTLTTMVNKRTNPEIREMLLGHKIGITGAYYRPMEIEMLDEYLKVVDDLTVNDENRLRKENLELQTTIDEKDSFIAQMRSDIEEIREFLHKQEQQEQFIPSLPNNDDNMLRR